MVTPGVPTARHRSRVRGEVIEEERTTHIPRASVRRAWGGRQALFWFCMGNPEGTDCAALTVRNMRREMVFFTISRKRLKTCRAMGRQTYGWDLKKSPEVEDRASFQRVTRLGLRNAGTSPLHFSWMNRLTLLRRALLGFCTVSLSLLSAARRGCSRRVVASMAKANLARFSQGG